MSHPYPRPHHPIFILLWFIAISFLPSLQAQTAFYATAYDPYTGDGKVVAIDSAGLATDYATGFSQPQGLVLDSFGNLFVIDEDTLWKITGLEEKTIAATKPNIYNSWALAIDAQNNIYVTGEASSPLYGPQVYKFTADSNYTLYDTWDQPSISRLGLAMGPDGALYATGDGIIRIDTDSGAATSYYDFTGDYFGFTPFDLAFDANGNLYVSGFDGDDQVLRISADLSTVTPIITEGLSGVRGITLDIDGNLYVANWSCGCEGPVGGILTHNGTTAVTFSNFGDTDDYNANYVVAVIPEPSAALLLPLALAIPLLRKLTRRSRR